MMKISGLLETSLYVQSLGRARDFYERILGLTPSHTDDRMAVYPLPRGGNLLVFLKEGVGKDFETPGGRVPAERGAGPTHVAFSIGASDIAGWLEQFARMGVSVESQVTWPSGAESVYFWDCDDNLLEIATDGIWPAIGVNVDGPPSQD